VKILAYRLNISAILPQISKIQQKLQFQKFVKNENIGILNLYVISQLIFFRGREIVQGGSEIMTKDSPKVLEKFWPQTL